MYIKRTLILSKLGIDDKKALATIQKNGDRPCMALRFQESLVNIFALVRFGTSPIDVVFLYSDGGVFMGDLPDYFDCANEIYITILKVVGGKCVPIYIGGGNQKRSTFYNDVLKDLPFFYNKCMSLAKQRANACEFIKFEQKPASEKKDKENLEEIAKLSVLDCDSEKTKKDDVSIVENKNALHEELFEPISDSEMSEIITDELLAECLQKNESCQDCAYKELYLKEKEKELKQNECDSACVAEISKNEVLKDYEEKEVPEEVVTNEEENAFFKQIEKSLNALFESYPRDNLLENAIENSCFVRVDYENTGDYYSVGYIMEDNAPKYICYAIPCSAGSPPPANMDNFSQYLSIDDEKGYYIMYQSAKDGETIFVENKI